MASRRSDDQIVRADHLALFFQTRPDFGVEASGAYREVQHADSGNDGLDESRSTLSTLLRVGAMDSLEQLRDSHDADVHFLQWFPGRQIDCLAAPLEVNEDVSVYHQSHGFVSAGNSVRMPRTSCANCSVSSPSAGRFRKKAVSPPTVRGDVGKSSIVMR